MPHAWLSCSFRNVPLNGFMAYLCNFWAPITPIPVFSVYDHFPQNDSSTINQQTKNSTQYEKNKTKKRYFTVGKQTLWHQSFKMRLSPSVLQLFQMECERSGNGMLVKLGNREPILSIYPMNQNWGVLRDCFLALDAFRLDNNAEVKIILISDKCENYFSLYSYTVYCQMLLYCAVLDQKIELGAGHYLSAGGGGGWAILGGGVMKKFYPKWGRGQNFIYESMEGWGVTNMISISFSGIKMLWLLGGKAPQMLWPLGGKVPQTPSPIIIFFIFHAPLLTTTTEKWKHEEICICWDALSQILLLQCTPSLDHTQVQTFYKVYIVSNFSYTKGQFTTPPKPEMSLVRVRK